MDTKPITLKKLAEQLNLLLENNPQYANYHIIVAAECGYSNACLAQFIDNGKFIGINEENKEIKLLTDDDELNRYCEYKLF